MFRLEICFIWMSIFYAISAVPVYLVINDNASLFNAHQFEKNTGTDSLYNLLKCMKKARNKLTSECLHRLSQRLKQELSQDDSDISNERMNEANNSFGKDYIDFSNNKLEDAKVFIIDFDNNEPQYRRFDNFVKNKILRSRSDSEDSSTESEEAKKEDSDQSSESTKDSSEEIEIPKPVKKKEYKIKKYTSPQPPKFYFMQGPSRLLASRRRLPHFLPKRYHWNEEEIKDLNNYWINGPQGKYSGLYKTPY